MHLNQEKLLFKEEPAFLSREKIKNEEWLDEELSESQFKDERLRKRFQVLCKQLWGGMGEPIPFACQDWVSTKAAYLQWDVYQLLRERDRCSAVSHNVMAALAEAVRKKVLQ